MEDDKVLVYMASRGQHASVNRIWMKMVPGQGLIAQLEDFCVLIFNGDLLGGILRKRIKP